MLEMIRAVLVFLFLFTASLVQASPLRLTSVEHHLGLHERHDRKTIQRLIGVDPSRTPWCGYAVAYAVRAAGGTPVAGYPSARSWTKYGRSTTLSAARPGDVVVYRFKRGYHVALFKSHASGGRHVACGGNMSNQFKCSSYRDSSVVAVRR